MAARDPIANKDRVPCMHRAPFSWHLPGRHWGFEGSPINAARVGIQSFSVALVSRQVERPLLLLLAWQPARLSQTPVRSTGMSLGAGFQHLPEYRDRREVSESSTCCSICLRSQMQSWGLQTVLYLSGAMGKEALRALRPTDKKYVTIKINPSTFIFGVEVLKYSCMEICL